MRLSSLTKRIFPDCAAQSSQCLLVDRINLLVRSSSDLNDLFAAAAEEIGRALNLAHVGIILRAADKIKATSLYFAQEIGYGAKEKFKLLDSVIERSFCDSTVPVEMSADELDSGLKAQFEHHLEDSASELGISALLIAPLVLDKNATGAILLYRRKPTRWSSQEKHLLQLISSTLTLAIDHIQSEERAKIAAEREAVTNRLLSAIRSAVNVDDILKVAVESLGAALRATRTVIYMRSRNESPGTNNQQISSLKARAEYRANALIPSALDTAIDVAASPLLGQLMAGDIITIPDTSESHDVVRAIGARLGVRALVLAPIAYNGQMVATLAIEQFDRPRQFTDEEIRLVRLVTEQAAVALYQAELFREAQESARRDALISRISSAVHSSLDPDEVLEAIVNEVGAALGVCRARLALLTNPLPEMLPITHEYVAECCADKLNVLTTIQVRGNNYLQGVLVSDAPVVVNDPLTDSRLSSVRMRVEAGGVKSIMTTAIRIGGQPIGIFSLHHCEKRHTWTHWEIDLVKSVAEQAAVAIRQAELYREVRESATRAALVNQIVASIRRSLDLKETLKVAVEELGRALGADRTYFRKLIGDKNIVVAEYLSDPQLSVSHIETPKEDYITSYLTETRRTLIIDDVRAFMSAYPDIAASVPVWHVEPLNLSQIVCPIFVNGEYWGALSIGQTDRVRKWTASEIALIEVVTAQVEVAVTHSYLFEEAKQVAEREALISHIIHGINQSNQLDEIFPIVASELGDHLATDSLVIMRLDEDREKWRIECVFSNGKVTKPARSYNADDFALFSEMVADDMILCDDVETDPRMAPHLDRFLRPAGTRAFMAVRLYYRGEPGLVIAAIMKSGPRHWTDDDVDIVRAAANQVFIAIQRAELFEQVSHGKYEWEATFDALTDGIFIFDRQGILRRVNQAGAAFEGEEIRNLIGRRCCTLMQGIEGEECRVSQVLKTARPVTFELVPERLGRPVLVTMSPLTIGSQSHFQDFAGSNGNGNGNNTIGAVCIVRDLSELRAAEAVAREQRGFLVKLIEHANDAIFALSPEGRLIWFNEQLVTLSEYSREELHGMGSWHFLPDNERDIATERFYRALQGEAQTFEMHALKKSGESRLLLVTYTPIYDEGRVTSILSIARDVTEERLASERAAQADKLRALGQLASGVAHNFNNILAAILGHAQLIKRDFKDDSLLQRMDIIERAALDGAQTVKRIQAFGLQQNETAQDVVDINQIVQDSTTLTRAKWCDEAQARGLHYEVEVELEEVPTVRGSGSELREVFVNVILNALDAMPQGGRLKIKTEAKDGSVRVSFADSGIGMSREVCDHIFEPFFTTKGATGMGLGLAVSYSIIERHGGRIEAQSSPGRGTTFTITLPTVESKQRKTVRDNKSSAKTASVLVIDDDERVRAALVGMLKSAGHRTDHAANGREALTKMEGGGFELVITDLSMPEMDGWAVASEIRRRWPGVKIVLITGYGVPPETISHRRELVNEVLFKPIRFDDITTTLGQVLS
ncbi:MAG TPA: GAF domain-containing protein [Blastocatellia bacterium]|nr:GAF domain-containing protein [Blastocatellia bacterium]